MAHGFFFDGAKDGIDARDRSRDPVASVGRIGERLRLLREGNLQLSPPLTLNPSGTKFTVNCGTPLSLARQVNQKNTAR